MAPSQLEIPHKESFRDVFATRGEAQLDEVLNLVEKKIDLRCSMKPDEKAAISAVLHPKMGMECGFFGFQEKKLLDRRTGQNCLRYNGFDERRQSSRSCSQVRILPFDICVATQGE